FARGDRLAIIGDNRPEWLYAELAAQSLGGVAVAVYQDSLAEQVRYVLEHSGARAVVVEDQEQVDKLLDLVGRLPRLERVIYDDPKGLARYAEPWLLGFGEVLDAGRAAPRREPDARAADVDGGGPEGVGLHCDPPGSTRAPERALVSRRNPT